MGLIRKAYIQGYFAQGCLAGHHQMACLLQTPSHNVRVRRLTNSQFELAREVSLASPRNSAELPNEDRTVQILVNVSLNTNHLPSRQTAVCRTCGGRTALDIHFQNMRRRGRGHDLEGVTQQTGEFNGRTPYRWDVLCRTRKGPQY